MDNDNFIIQEVKKVAFKSLEVFLDRINLSIDLFEHLNDIKVEIGDTKLENAFAEYYPDANTMTISRRKVNSGLRKVRYEELLMEDFIDNVAISYLHEMIHANRTIIIANLLNIYNFDEGIYKDNYNKAFNKELVKYRQALNNILSRYDISKFDKYVPVIISFNENATYNVVAYNLDNSSFDLFKNQRFNSILKDSRYNFLYNISSELSLTQPVVDEEIFDYFDFEEIISLPCDYNFNKNIYYEFRNQMHYKKLEKKIKQQISLEEIITESLAIIMVLTKDEEEIDYDMVLEAENIDENDVIGINLIKQLDDETLRWYFLSSYDEVYYDKFHKLFQEKYRDLLKIMYKIYELERPVTDEIMSEFNFIVRTKLNGRNK